VTTLRALRQFLGRDRRLEAISTQEGFARYIGRSQSLIRAVDSGQIQMSGKLAKLIATKTGASFSWLTKMEPGEGDDEILNAEDGPLTYEEVSRRWEQDTRTVPKQILKTLDPPLRPPYRDAKPTQTEALFRAVVRMLGEETQRIAPEDAVMFLADFLWQLEALKQSTDMREWQEKAEPGDDNGDDATPPQP